MGGQQRALEVEQAAKSGDLEAARERIDALEREMQRIFDFMRSHLDQD